MKYEITEFLPPNQFSRSFDRTLLIVSRETASNFVDIEAVDKALETKPFFSFTAKNGNYCQIRKLAE